MVPYPKRGALTGLRYIPNTICRHRIWCYTRITKISCCWYCCWSLVYNVVYYHIFNLL